MLLDRFNKQPNARKKYQIDFSDWMDDSVVVTDVQVTVEILGDDGAPEPTLTVDGGSIVGGTVYQFFVNAGTDKKQYKATFLVTFSDTQVEEWEIEYRVNDS